MTRRRLRTFLGAFGLALAGLVVTAGPAAADPAGPTDYRSEVVRVDPATPAIDVRVVGGDSFVLLRAERGTTVDVVGYRGEPYLRFGADGTVERNEASPSRWLNDDRYGSTEPPPSSTPGAEPDWRVVATDGSYAWHDHRAHWMNPARPPGAEPGDTILEAVIPLVVDGDEVDVHVRSVLLARPSPAAAIVGGSIAFAAVGALLLGGRRVGNRSGLLTVAAGGAALATVLGGWAYRSVPAETEPSVTLWLLPATALVAALGALVLGRTGRVSRFGVDLLGALAALELGLWAWSRRAAPVRAWVPTDAPQWLDRATVTGAGALALGVAVGLLVLRRTTPTTT